MSKRPSIVAITIAAFVVCYLGWRIYRPPPQLSRTYRIGIDESPPLLEPLPDGKMGGIALDVLKEAARRRGVRLKWVRVTGTSPDDAIRTGQVDLWPVVGITPERTEWYHLTRPWIFNTYAVITRKADRAGVQDLRNKTIAFSGLPLATKLATASLASSRLARQPSRVSVIEQVCMGSADAGFEEAAFVNWALLDRPTACRDIALSVTLTPDAVARGAIGATPEAAPAADLLRDEIDELARDGTMAASLSRWASFSASETGWVLQMQDAQQWRRWLWYAVLGACCAAAGLLWMYRTALQRKRELTDILESTTDSVLLLDANWQIVYLNPQALAQMESGIELAGKNLWEEFPQAKDTKFWTYYHQCMKTQKAISFEETYEGQVIEVHAYPSPTRLTIFFRNITAKRKTEDELHQRQKQLDGISAHVPGAVYQLVLSPEGSWRFPFVSAGVEPLIGINAEGVMADPEKFFGAVVPEDVEALKESLAYSAASLSLWQATFRVLTPDGLKWVSGRSVPESATHGDVIWNGVLIDITAQKQAEEQILYERDRAESATRAKSAFLAAMSHEIRTPLNGVLGGVNLLQQTSLDAEQKELAHTIQTSGDLLLALVNDVLDFSKIEAGKLDIEFKPFSLHELLESVLDLCGGAADRKAIDLELAIHETVPDWVGGDPQRITQVLMNLVANAIKFTDTGAVTVSVDAASGPVRIEVRDTGIGISLDAQARLFEEFRQGDSSMARRYGGTGLGLAIAKRLITIMGGNIHLVSAPGAGSTFTVELPLRAAESGAPQSQSEVHAHNAVLLTSNPPECTFARFFAQAGITIETKALRSASATRDFADCCFVVLEGSHADMIRAAREVRKSSPERSSSYVALMAVKRRRTVRELRLDGWICLTAPLTRERVLQYLAAAPGAAATTGAAIRKVSKARVLLAEDNPTNQLVARRMLERLGCAVDIAPNGCAAVDAVRSADYDLILMDCQMPEMDGFQATSLIRQEQRCRHLPVIALTANATTSDREMCLAAGMDDYLSKPVPIEALSQMLAKWVLPRAAEEIPVSTS